MAPFSCLYWILNEFYGNVSQAPLGITIIIIMLIFIVFNCQQMEIFFSKRWFSLRLDWWMRLSEVGLADKVTFTSCLPVSPAWMSVLLVSQLLNQCCVPRQTVIGNSLLYFKMLCYKLRLFQKSLTSSSDICLVKTNWTTRVVTVSAFPGKASLFDIQSPLFFINVQGNSQPARNSSFEIFLNGQVSWSWYVRIVFWDFIAYT